AALSGQRPQRLDPRVLKRVVGLLRVAEYRPAAAIELLVIALAARCERALLPTHGDADQAGVRRQAQCGRPRVAGAAQCCFAHAVSLSVASVNPAEGRWARRCKNDARRRLSGPIE